MPQLSPRLFVAATVSIVLIADWSPLTADDTSPTARSTGDTQPATPDVVELPRVSIDVARSRAELIHNIYSSTLDTMHHRYFHGDRAVVPARAMEDMFEDLERQQHIQARWISASFSPMSIDHEPKSDFEKQAARKIAKGESVIEVMDAGYYRRAGAIALGNGCVSCHSGLFAGASTTPKFAGLVISVPVHPNSKLESVLPAAQP